MEISVVKGEVCLLLASASGVPFGITPCRLFRTVPAESNVEALVAGVADNKSFDTVVIVDQSARHNTPEFTDIVDQSARHNTPEFTDI